MLKKSLVILNFIFLVISFSHVYGQVISDYSVKIDSLIQTTIPRKYNGVILITKKGKTVYSRAYGYSNFEQKIPITIKDNFRIQSNSKQVTAVLILKEVENGKINLYTPIRRYLPEFKQPWADTVTVHQLLNMSSGITALDKPLIFRPGTGSNYSNAAYALLGRIIENVRKEKYSKTANALFERLKMHDSYCYEIGGAKRLINGYYDSLSNFKLVNFNSIGLSNEAWNDFIPAGGIISNAADLNLWDTKLHNGQILKPETYKAMINSEVKDFHEAFSSEQIYYGYGVNISDRPVKYIGHPGRGLGFVSIKFYVPAKDLDVIVLENVYNNDVKVVYHFEKAIREIVLNSSLVK